MDGVDQAQARTQVSGRLSAGKSPSYLRAIGQVEARANPHLARYMIASDLAFALTAAELRIPPPEASRALVSVACELLDEVDTLPDPQTSDIVVTRKHWYESRLPPETAQWMHLGRSRGESLRSYLPRLCLREALWQVQRESLYLVEALLERAGATLRTPAPAYHHLQHAGVTTLGEYLLSWVAVMLRHVERAADAYERLDRAPTVGTSRDVAKELSSGVARRLGFSRQAQVRRDATWCEDHFSEPLWALTVISVELGRLAEDLRLWSTAEFALFELSDRHASTSSSLPQKKNAFGLQAVIGGAAAGTGRLMTQLAANICPSDQSDAYYHAGGLYEFAQDVAAWAHFMGEVVTEGHFDAGELERKALTGYAGTGEARDVLVFDHGVPFEAAHLVLGEVVRADSTGQPLPGIRELLSSVTGREIDVDEAGLVALIRGDVLPPGAVDAPRIEAYWSACQASLAAERERLGDASPVESMIAALAGEARQWLEEAGAGSDG